SARTRDHRPRRCAVLPGGDASDRGRGRGQSLGGALMTSARLAQKELVGVTGESLPTVRIIRSEAQALEVARNVAEKLALGAAERDRKRTIPEAEMDLLSASGLLGITVPRAYGGAD